MEKEITINKENIVEEYFDDSFYEMDLNDKIQFLKKNPEKKISPDDVETTYFWELSQTLTEASEKELSIKIFELYYNAVIEAQRELFYRRVRPCIDAIYAYGMHLLGNKITPAEELSDKLIHLFVELCMMNMAIYAEEVDEVLERYPQYAELFDLLPELSYADDDAIFPQLLCNIGRAFQRGTQKLEKNPEKAFDFFIAGAELDYEHRYALWPRAKAGDCAFEAAVCFMKGIGVKKDFDAALEYFELGAQGYGERAVPAMADIYLDPEFEWQEYFETDEERYLAAFSAFNVRVRSFDGSYMKPVTHYTSEDWDCYLDDYDEDEKEERHKLFMARLENYASSGSWRAAQCLAIAYEKGILVEEDSEHANYFREMEAFWLGKTFEADVDDEEGFEGEEDL